MISNIFFQNSIDNKKKNNFIYDEIFVNYIIAKQLFLSKEGINDYTLKSILDEFYFPVKVNKSRLSYLLDEKYGFNHLSRKLPARETRVIKEVNAISDDNKNVTFKEIVECFNNYIDNLNNDFHKLQITFLSFLVSEKLAPKDYVQSLVFNLLMNYENLHSKLEDIIEGINPFYSTLPLNVIFHEKIISNVLIGMEKYVLNDLKTLPIDVLMVILSSNIENYILVLKRFTSYDDIETKINKVFSILDERDYYVINHRFGLETGIKKTLEMIGNDINLTRERVRQIEKKSIQKINTKLDYLKYDIYQLFNSIKTSKEYITKDELTSQLSTSTEVNKVLFLLEYSVLPYVYVEKYALIYNREVSDIEQIINELFLELGKYVTPSTYAGLSIEYRTIVKEHYRLTKTNNYFRKNVRIIDIITEMIINIFPDGYRIGSEEDYNKLKSEFDTIFDGSELILSQPHAVASLINRGNFCLVDRGRYKHSDLCATLPDYLIIQILKHISVQQDIVHYQSIYDSFKKEFDNLGVHNRYYVKGLIDPYLPEEFNTKRDYIQLTSERISSFEAIGNYINSLDGVFSMQNLMNRFKGVKEYTFFNYLYENSDIIWLRGKRFIHIKNIDINKNSIVQLKKIIDDTFSKLNARTITTRKLWAKLRLTNKTLLNSFQYIECEFDLFSLITALFSDDYYFRRPLISLDTQDNLSNDNLYQEYVSRFDQFSHDTVKRFKEKMNLRDMYSYLIFMENMSDGYVQVDMGSMVSKEKMNISNEMLSDIKEILNLILVQNESIDTRKFKGYSIFPKLKYGWNKYSLAGIVRSYFYKDFEVENTENFYTTTDFIIRRI